MRLIRRDTPGLNAHAAIKALLVAFGLMFRNAGSISAMVFLAPYSLLESWVSFGMFPRSP